MNPITAAMSAFPDIPGGWASIIAAVLTIVGGPVTVAVFGSRLSKRVKAIRHDVAITKDHVANSHVDADGVPINMRDEQDRYQVELVRKLDEIQATQRTQGRDIGGLRSDIRNLTAADLEHTRAAAENREHITALEQTHPPRPIRPRKPRERK